MAQTKQKSTVGGPGTDKNGIVQPADGAQTQPDIQYQADTPPAEDPAISLFQPPDPNTRYASTSRARASTREVQGNELASNQLDKILAEDSPLRRRAMQAGIDFAASRGLANSSIAGGNAVGSLIDRASPIAQFDAAAYGTAARDNQTAENQIGLFNANADNQTSQFNANADNTYRDQWANNEFQAGENQNERDWKTGENDLNRNFDLLMQKNDQDFKTSLAEMEATLTREGYDNQQKIAILDSIARARSDRADLLGQGALAIYQNPKMKAGEQNQALANWTNTSNKIYNELVSDFPDLPDLFPDLFNE